MLLLQHLASIYPYQTLIHTTSSCLLPLHFPKVPTSPAPAASSSSTAAAASWLTMRQTSINGSPPRVRSWMKTLRYGSRREITRLMVGCSLVQMERRITCHLTRHGSWMTLSMRKIHLDKL